MQNGGSYTNDTDAFLSKIMTLSLRSNNALFAEDTVAPHVSILSTAGFNALKNP